MTKPHSRGVGPYAEALAPSHRKRAADLQWTLPWRDQRRHRPGRTNRAHRESDNTLKLWDFTRGVAHRALEPRVAAAQAALQRATGDPVALATFGEWYAFRGMNHWAIDFFSRARTRRRGRPADTGTLLLESESARRGTARIPDRLGAKQGPGRANLPELVHSSHRHRAGTQAARSDAAEHSRRGPCDFARSDWEVPRGGVRGRRALQEPGLDRRPVVRLRLRLFPRQRQGCEQEERVRRPGDGIAPEGREGGLEQRRPYSKDTDLDPLRERDDFKKLLADLEKKPAGEPGKQP